MKKPKEFFDFIKYLEKEEGYDPNKKIEKGFYIRTMGLSIIITLILIIIVVSSLIKLL